MFLIFCVVFIIDVLSVVVLNDVIMSRSGPYLSHVVSAVVFGSFVAFLDFVIIFSSNCCDHDDE